MFSARTFASAPIARNTKAALSLLAMEPRMLFDGAGAVAAVNHDPIAVADCRTVATDSAIVAASAFCEHGFKTIPVVADKVSRRIVGVVRVRRLIARVLEIVPPPTGLTAPPMPPA